METQKIKVFEITVITCLVIVTCFASVALFSWVKCHNNPAFDYVDSKVAELEHSIARKIKKSEVAMLQELLAHLEERGGRDTVEVSELVEQREEEVVDCIPCCGGEDSLTNISDATNVNDSASVSNWASVDLSVFGLGHVTDYDWSTYSEEDRIDEMLEQLQHSADGV